MVILHQPPSTGPTNQLTNETHGNMNQSLKFLEPKEIKLDFNFYWAWQVLHYSHLHWLPTSLKTMNLGPPSVTQGLVSTGRLWCWFWSCYLPPWSFLSYSFSTQGVLFLVVYIMPIMDPIWWMLIACHSNGCGRNVYFPLLIWQGTSSE